MKKSTTYHTFTETNEKKIIFVLKGHFYISPEELLARLKDVNVPASMVTFLNKSLENPSYLIKH